MNNKQLVSMWCGIGLILFIAVITFMYSYEPDYAQFIFWALLVVLVTVGLITTFKTKKAKRNGSRKMNLHKGFKRLVFILSLIPALIGIAVFIVGLVEGCDDMLIGGALTVLIGFVAIWSIYGIVLYILNGFNANYCANCERIIGKLEEEFKFNEHVVCAECHEKLNGNQKSAAS